MQKVHGMQISQVCRGMRQEIACSPEGSVEGQQVEEVKAGKEVQKVCRGRKVRVKRVVSARRTPARGRVRQFELNTCKDMQR